MSNKKLLLILILFFAFFIRVFKIGEMSLYGDELTMVYDSFSILKTGTDQTGEAFPLTFSMGAGRPAGYVYGSIPFVALFGPSAYGVRGLSLLSGVGIVLLIYLIGKQLFSEKVALFCCFIAAISPMGISLSRGGFEANFALFLALLGILAFLKSHEKPIFYVLWAISWGVAIHTYPTFKLALPIFFIVLIYFTNRLKSLFLIKLFLLSGVMLAIFIMFSITETLGGRSEARFFSINIFTDQEVQRTVIEKINYERTISNLSSSLKPFFYNKPLEYGKVFLENYSKNLSLNYLLIKGDENPRHNPAEVGTLYLIELFLIAIALLNLWSGGKKRLLFFLGFWILLTPIATSLISDPHHLRNAFMLPPLALLSGYGLSNLSKKIIVVCVLLLLAQFFLMLERIYFLAPDKFASFWSQNAKVASQIAIHEKDNFDYVMLSDHIDNMEFAYPVYSNTDPKIVITQNKKRSDLVGFKLKQIGNVYIGRIPEREIENFQKTLNGNLLYIGDSAEASVLHSSEIVKSSDLVGGLVIKRFR